MLNLKSGDETSKVQKQIGWHHIASDNSSEDIRDV
jgi:hypothetical protein